MDHAISPVPSRPIELRHASTDRPNVIVVPERHFLAIEGIGHPGASGFRLATAALRTAHEAVRLSLRHDWLPASGRPVFEIIWLTDPDWPIQELQRVLSERDTVRWQQMLELPAGASPALIAGALERSRSAGASEGPDPSQFTMTEGPAAQLLHLGPTDLSATVARLHGFITDSGWRPRGGIHQLALADSESVPVGRARSIIRMPIAPG